MISYICNGHLNCAVGSMLCVKSKRNSVEPLRISFDTVAEKIAEQTGDIAKDLRFIYYITGLQ